MASTTLTEMETAMKVIFAPALHNNVVADSDVADIIKSSSKIKTDETTGGRYIEHVNRMRVSGGFRGAATGAGGPRDAIPEADPPEFINPKVYLRKHSGTMEMDGDTMRRVKSGPGAWVTYLESELPAFKDRVSSEYDRMWVGFGNGVKARVRNFTGTINGVAYTGGVSAMNTPSTGRFMVLIDRAYGAPGFTEAWTLFLEGERSVFTASWSTYPQTLRNAGTGQSALVVDIDDVNGALTYQGLDALRGAIAANDYIGLGDTAGHAFPVSATTNREMMGLLAGVDNGGYVATYHGIARSTRRLWNSVVIDASVDPYDGTLQEDLIEYGDDSLSRRGGGRLTTLLTSHSGIRAFKRSMDADRTFNDPRTYVGGANRDGLGVLVGTRKVRLRVGRKIPPEVTLGLMEEFWTRYTLGAFEFDDTTGSMWNRVTDANGRYDQFYCTAHMYEESYCAAPRKQLRFDNLRAVS